MGIFDTAYTYLVEIAHPGGEWHQIHCPAWETTGSYPDAMAYALTVRDDHPGSRVRILETAEGMGDQYVAVPA